MNNWSWIFKMAIKDAKQNRRRLIVYASSIVLGIASLVAIQSFKINLSNQIDDEAKTLLGADLVFRNNNAWKPDQLAIIDSISNRQAKESSFATMLYNPKNERSKLVNARAIIGQYPFYGDVTSEPQLPLTDVIPGGKVMIDKTALLQLNLSIGDSVKIGKSYFEIIAAITKAPGANNIAATVAPPVYFSMKDLPETGLLQIGSRIRRKIFLRTDSVPGNEELKSIEDRLYEDNVKIDTIESRKEDLKEFFDSLSNFLNLIGFVALILGCLGIASSINIYLKSKTSTIATLRCLGTSNSTIFWIFFIEILLIGFITSIIGILAGSLLQTLLPFILQDILIVDVNFSPQPIAMLYGLLVGILASILFTIEPLLKWKNTPPLAAIQVSANETSGSRLKWLVRIGMLLFVWIFAFTQLNSWVGALIFTCTLGVVILLLTGVAQLLIKGIKSSINASWNYTTKQGLSNIFRPNNQTLELSIIIGLGTLMISMLLFIQNNLLEQLQFADQENQPNMILFDIQENQINSMKTTLEENDLPVKQVSPIVSMRLASLNGRTRVELKNDTTSDIPSHILNREYRSSYRDYLLDEEEIIEGEFIGKYDGNGSIPVVIEERTAEFMNIEIGDPLSFNVSGIEMKVVVGAIYRIDRTKVQTSFNVLFPENVLEQAPKFYAVVTRTPNEVVSAEFQNTIVLDYPNVSVVDLKSILETVKDVVSKIELIIQFMAMFSLLTGIIVLVGSIRNSKFQRLQDNQLLRTIGASKAQINRITVIEYWVLGIAASLTGVILASVLSYLVVNFTFRMDFQLDWIAALLIVIVTSFVIALIGYFNNRKVLIR